MSNTIRSQEELLALFHDNNKGEISAQDLRDLTVTSLNQSVPQLIDPAATPGTIRAADTARAAILSPSVYSDFSGLADGLLAGNADSGQPWIIAWNSADAAPTVVSGRLTQTSTAGSRASYSQIDMGANVVRIGGKFSFHGGSTAGGSCGLNIWKGNAIASGGGIVPDSPMHLSFGLQYAILGTWTGNTFTQLVSWTYRDSSGASVILSKDTTYTSEVEIDYATGTVTVLLPDGIVRQFTHASVIANAGTYADWETYLNVASTDDKGGWIEVWGDSEPISSRRAIPSRAEIAVQVVRNSSRTRIVVTEWAPATTQTITCPQSTDAAISSGNLSISFVVPDSGSVLLMFSGAIAMNAAGNVVWALMEGASVLKIQQITNGQQFSGRLSASFLMTGLSPGATKMYTWGHHTNLASGVTFIADAPVGKTAHMVAHLI